MLVDHVPLETDILQLGVAQARQRLECPGADHKRFATARANVSQCSARLPPSSNDYTTRNMVVLRACKGQSGTPNGNFI